MLDPWIIEQIRRREQEERVREQPSVDLPLPPPFLPGEEPQEEATEDSSERGVVIIGI